MAKKVTEVNVVQPSEFVERNERPTNYAPVIFNKDTQKTELLQPDALLGGQSVNLLWSPTAVYHQNEIREFNLKLWKSLSDGNEGNTPFTGSLFWEEVSKSEAGYTPLWAAGGYLTAYAKVLKLNSGDNKLYEYVLRATAPFESVDFDAELAAGDWQLIGGSGGTADIATNADMDAGTNDTKAVSPLKFVYGITTRVFSALKTTAKSIQGAINELFDKLLLKAEAHPSWDASTVPTSADIVINEIAGTLTFGTINGAPISVNNPAIYFVDIAGKASRYLITAPVVFDWSAKTEGIWWFWFDSSGPKVQNISTGPGFGTSAPLYRFYYSAVDGVVNTRAAEFHPNTQSGIEHEWKHNTFGTVWENGFNLVCNPLASGPPAASGLNTCISLTGGTNLDDNFRYTIANNTSGAAWSQDLGNPTAASITTANGLLARMSYNDSLGRLRLLPATRFPFHFIGDVPQTIGADGTVTPVPNNYFFVTFTYCLQDDKAGEPVRVRSYVSSFSTIDASRAAQWEDLVSISPTLGDKEIRPLHRHIWERRTAYDNAVKQSVLRETLDIRKERVKSISVSSTTVLSSNVALATPQLGASNQDEINIELVSYTTDTGRIFNPATNNVITKKETEFNNYVQTGVLNINASNITNSFGDLAVILLPIETNGDDINVFGGVGLYLNSNDYSNDSALYHLFILYANGNPYWALKKVTNTEVVYPLILNYNGDNLNDYITLNFSEICYGNNSASAPILASDLTLTVIDLGNTSAISIGSISDTNGDALTEGASAIRVNLSITGTPDGTEQISISPVSDSIFNANGIAMQTDQSTGVIGLNNDTIPQLNAPVLTGLVVDGISQITATWTDTNTSPNESSFTLQADTSALFDSVNLVEVSGIAANDITEAVTGLMEDTDYYLRVRAIGDGIAATSSVWSNILNERTAVSNLPFLMTIETTTNNYAVTILLHQGFTGYYDGIINFGDGSGDKVIGAYNDPNLTHTYTTAGTYQISLSGKLSGLNNGTANTYKTLIKSVDQWGTVEWATLLNMFNGCSGLITIPTGPFTGKNASNIINATQMFRACVNTTNIMQSGFLDNLTGLTNVSNMYYDALRNKTIPNNFFVNNKLITNYSGVFQLCRNCTLPANLFDLSALSVVTTFANFMNALLVGYSNSGTIQDIWNYATSATPTDAFNNQTALSNYASIPSTWT